MPAKLETLENFHDRFKHYNFFKYWVKNWWILPIDGIPKLFHLFSFFLRGGYQIIFHRKAKDTDFLGKSFPMNAVDIPLVCKMSLLMAHASSQQSIEARLNTCARQ